MKQDVMSPFDIGRYTPSRLILHLQAILNGCLGDLMMNNFIKQAHEFCTDMVNRKGAISYEITSGKNDVRIELKVPLEGRGSHFVVFEWGYEPSEKNKKIPT